MAGPNKDAYYFPHFSNARHDSKIKRLRKELGIEGYGIYFMILEVLRDQEDLSYPIADIDLLAEEFSTIDPKVEAVVKKYGLFKVGEDNYFYSPKLIEYLQPYFAKSKRGRAAALKRWHGNSNANADANALPLQSSSSAKRGEESKREEMKEETESKIPSLSDVRSYFVEYGYDPEIGERAWNYYNESVRDSKKKYWRDSKGNMIKNWKRKMQAVWFKPENKIKSDFEKALGGGTW